MSARMKASKKAPRRALVGKVPESAAPAKPKRPQPKGGSRKGVPNKATQTAREAIALFVDGNAHRLAGWLDKIAKDNPEKAFRAFMDVVEYHVPKLARTEHVGDGGGPVQIVASREDEAL